MISGKMLLVTWNHYMHTLVQCGTFADTIKHGRLAPSVRHKTKLANINRHHKIY